jgi:hypothetical protein
MEFKTTHNLLFEVAEHWTGTNLFKIGTCHGQWGSTKDSYYILSVINENPGNGHLVDVFEWFENSCKRDNRNLLILECFNENFYKYLISKEGFIPLDPKGENAIKIFNRKAYKQLIKNGNEIIMAGTLRCV